jgi:hypothetical protein
MMQTVYYIAGSIAAIGTLVAAIIAVCVYRRNWRLEQSRWASSFYEKFYESDKYKTIREKLDRSDEASINALVEDEEAEFTDYLNFFEHVAIFAKSKQLNKDDVEASFAYYLNCLYKLGAVRKYIEDDENGFEQLKEFLQNRSNP